MTYKRLYRIVRRNKPVKMLEKIVLNYATAHIYLRDRLESVYLSVAPDSILCLLDGFTKIIKDARYYQNGNWPVLPLRRGWAKTASSCQRQRGPVQFRGIEHGRVRNQGSSNWRPTMILTDQTLIPWKKIHPWLKITIWHPTFLCIILHMLHSPTSTPS